MSFFEIEYCWFLGIVSISRVGILSDDSRHLEQLGAERQARALRCGQVDLETDSILFRDKLDHATTLRELRDVTDGQDRALIQRLNDSVKPVGL